MDLLRHGYKTRMRFYRDVPDETEVVWYPVPDDTPFLPHSHVFGSWEWVEDNRPNQRTPGGVELGEQIEASRIFPGRPLPRRTTFTGKLCGDPAEWLNGASLPIVPPVLLPDGFPPCCGQTSVPMWDISDCADLAKMAECLRLQYNGAVVVKNYLIEQFGEVWTFPYTQENDATLMPGYIVADNPDWAMVIVSGTTNFNQYMQQALGSLAPGGRGTPAGNTYATSNVYEDAGRVIANRVRQFIDFGKKVLVIGHSYGGCAAHVATAKLGDSADEYQIYLATFGAPRSGDLRLHDIVSRVAEGVANVINDGDPVPRFPIWTSSALAAAFPLAPFNVWGYWSNNPNRLGLRIDGTMYANPSSYITTDLAVWILARFFAGGFVFAFGDHDTGEYKRRLELENCDGPAPAPAEEVIHFKTESLDGLADFDPIDEWVNSGKLVGVDLHQFDEGDPSYKLSDLGWSYAVGQVNKALVLDVEYDTPGDYMAFAFAYIPPSTFYQFLSGDIHGMGLHLTPTKIQHGSGASFTQISFTNPGNGPYVYSIRRVGPDFFIGVNHFFQKFTPASNPPGAFTRFTPTTLGKMLIPPFLNLDIETGLIESKVILGSFSDGQWFDALTFFLNKFSVPDP